MEVKAHSFYLSYEVNFRDFNENLPATTPIEFNCYFDVVNNTNKPLSVDFVYNNNDVIEFTSDTDGDYFYTISSGDSMVALRPLHRNATILPDSSQIVPTEFPYRESNKLKEVVKGVSMEQITEKVSDINFFFKRNGADLIEVNKSDLYVYFMFSDTSITCTPKVVTHILIQLQFLRGNKDVSLKGMQKPNRKNGWAFCFKPR
ncbi:MAG: hypothetical protein HWD62_10555 [Cyclobacteriaceae bacterium]|nr:MAG: hypothetical protein HWD62_10555 [Cyclobacteriaceae bacterium]